MTGPEKVSEFWRAFCSAASDIDPETAYQVWFFGNTPDLARDLADLVLSGKKVATAGLASVNELEPDKAPVPDGYSIITDFHGHPVCVIRTTEIRHLPFNEVDPEFASDEGEGDQTLEHWRDVHRNYFMRESAGLGLDFDERTIVCCERFTLLYPR